ncbi:hypothetical protein L6V77_18870 [Myxococcota bacterium]|nr:hypothetical protein [Myxococcota bacterium]
MTRAILLSATLCGALTAACVNADGDGGASGTGGTGETGGTTGPGGGDASAPMGGGVSGPDFGNTGGTAADAGPGGALPPDASGCTPACEVGTTRCGPGGVATCAVDGAPGACAAWGPEVACPEGESCSDGACAPLDACTDECAAGQSRCGGDAAGAGEGPQTCGQFDEDACLDWGAVTPCPAGETCSLGTCAPIDACQDECAADTLRCGPAGSPERCGDYDADPCLEWAAWTPCEADETCEAGLCVPSGACEHACVGEARQCAEGGVQTCGDFDADPCADWSPPVFCPEGEVCSGGRCEAQCSDECARGAVRCGPQGGIETCGNFDADGCNEFSEAAPCPDGTSCSGGACAPLGECTDECAVGAVRCGDGGVQRCGLYDADDCAEWGAGTPCPGGEVCALGACARACQDECAAGSLRCQGEAVEQCGQFDADDCAEWSTATPCAAGELCAGGQCADACVAECAVGAVRCAPEGLQTCAPVADCPRWGIAAPCPAGTTCSDGRCDAVCVDECAAGEARCGAGGREICGQYDADACREWSAAIACPAGESCSGGACAVDCVDECAVGERQCAGTAADRTCGQHDGDACTEWGAETPCAAGEVCEVAACEACVPAPEVPNGLDDDCDGIVDDAPTGVIPAYCALQHPPRLVTTEGMPTLRTYGRVYAEGLTEGRGAHPSVRMQAGYGPRGTVPDDGPSWTWDAPVIFNVQAGNDDEYAATLTVLVRGSYDFAWRASIDGGETWVPCDRDGTVDGQGYDPAQAGELVVGPGPWWSNLQWPHVIELAAAPDAVLPSIYGRIYQQGVTDRPGAGAGVRAEVGYGPDGSDPRDPEAGWRWFPGAFNVDVGDDDEYCAGAACCAGCGALDVPAPAAGEWDFGWRYSLDGGVSWVFADIDGSPNGFAPLTAGRLTVGDVARAVPVQWAGNWGVLFSRDANCAAPPTAMEEPVDVDSWDRERAACRQITAEVYAPGHTDVDGSDPALLRAEMLRRPVVDGVAGEPESLPLTYYRRVGNNHEYRLDLPFAEFMNPPARRFEFFFRFSGDAGATWHRIGVDEGPAAAVARTLVYSL